MTLEIISVELKKKQLLVVRGDYEMKKSVEGDLVAHDSVILTMADDSINLIVKEESIRSAIERLDWK